MKEQRMQRLAIVNDIAGGILIVAAVIFTYWAFVFTMMPTLEVGGTFEWKEMIRILPVFLSFLPGLLHLWTGILVSRGSRLWAWFQIPAALVSSASILFIVWAVLN